LAWKKTPVEQGGLGDVRFPMVADISKRIASDYDVLIDNDFVMDEHGNLVPILGGNVALRGLFLIDKQGFVRHQLVNDKPLGRSVEEALRMLDALQYFEQHGEVCPANWKPGKQALKTTSADVGEFLRQYGKTL
jgi:peroxiredoxin (alkyl hydroperoxide reductase subunit C)